MELDKITIRGAKENNLKNISLEIPRNKMVVMQVFQEVERPRLPLIRFMPKDNDAM